MGPVCFCLLMLMLWCVARQMVHAGVDPDARTGAILTPIYQSTTYVQDSVENYLLKGYSYSRTANPVS
jgi:O-acetylhomoserine/O-acetylserine sulfhydrylase-like pyridoxal-dependent enzyme